MRKIFILLIVLYSFPDSFLYAQIKVIHFGKLIDGQGKVLLNVVVIVNGDRIVKVGTEKDVAIPTGAQTFDLMAYTAIPGLMDAHTHMTYYWDKTPGTTPWGQLGTLGPAVTVFLARENARKALECGVTTVRDLGSIDNMDFAMRDLINRGAMQGPRMFVVGCGLHIRSTPYKIGAVPDAGQCDGIAAVQRVAREQIQ